ncbi:MAG TPA: DUF4974 domain-containing protein [Bacteroidetes bacterium]|nr:DUF4974 domain-containing protein [Bacteroidota bacterium]HIL56359.1 DUF4974 domain-containing protein [Rhodothermales bacterium]
MPRSVLPPDLRDASAEERAELEQVWARLGDAPPPAPPADTDAAWDRLSSRLGLDAEPPRSPRRAPDRRSRPLPRRWIGTGLAALAVAVVAFVALPTLVAPVSVQAAPGSTEVVVLPDGSRVTLAPGARLTYAKRFGSWIGAPSERQVALVGEGAFEVESRTAPFIVETFNARVEVLGTRFGVRAYWREGETRVAVEEGSVRVDAAGETVQLGAAEGTVVAGSDAPPTAAQPADASRALAWTSGGLAFDDLPLADAFREIERRYDVQIDAGGNVPADADVTAFYARAPDVRTVLGDLCAAHGLRFEATSRGFTVTASPAAPTRRAPAPSRSSAAPR